MLETLFDDLGYNEAEEKRAKFFETLSNMGEDAICGSDPGQDEYITIQQFFLIMRDVFGINTIEVDFGTP